MTKTGGKTLHLGLKSHLKAVKAELQGHLHFLNYFTSFYLRCLFVLLGCCCCGGSVFYIINRPFAEWLVIHVVQNRRAGEQKSQSDKTKKRHT